jgi:tRNA pseudouridine55 synthase
VPRDGFLNLLKPPGMTSHDVVAAVRSRLRIQKVGHLGTLDPAAAGVLPLSVGRATRLFDYAVGETKSYRAEIIFGLTTDTLDAEGSVTATGDAGALTRVELLDLLPRFTGDIEQVPPAYSAIQVNGKRLYELARKGEAPVVKPRRVRIDSVTLAGFWPGRRARALIDVVCGAGTYLRVLAYDLGHAIGCGAYLSFLLRTRVGRFELADAITLEEMDAAAGRDELADSLLQVDWPLAHLPAATLAEDDARRFGQGTRVAADIAAVEVVRVYGPGESFLGIGAVSEGHLRPRVVVAGPGESAA